MGIIIREGTGKTVHLRLPTGLIMNGVSAAVLSARLRAQGVDISAKQLRILFHAIKEYQNAYPDWKLVEVESGNGTLVEIVI